MHTGFRVILHMVISVILVVDHIVKRRETREFNRSTSEDMDYTEVIVPSNAWCAALLLLINIQLYFVIETILKFYYN